MKNLLLSSLFLLFACNEKNKEDIKLKNVLSDKNIITNENTTNTDYKFDFNDKLLKSNLNKAILENDTIAYKSAYKKYVTNGRSKEFLYYALLMAEKNNYKKAYNDVSTILDFEINDPLVVKYKFTSKYGKYSLLKAYELGDLGAKQSANYVYSEKGKKMPKSNSVYCSE